MFFKFINCLKTCVSVFVCIYSSYEKEAIQILKSIAGTDEIAQKTLEGMNLVTKYLGCLLTMDNKLETASVSCEEETEISLDSTQIEKVEYIKIIMIASVRT